MLKSLIIHNYAIINHLEIDFYEGLNIITGETGAGKSIVLGALSLLLGQRADSTILMNQDQKCVVEGHLAIAKYNLETFFKENEIDYDDYTIIRREIAINGKSRAFVNDIPVNLNILKDLGIQLIDIHSQHENLNLQNNDFQLKVVDTLADNMKLLKEFRELYKLHNQLQSKLMQLKEDIDKLKTDREYFEFQFGELEKAALKEEELEELEKEYNTLTHIEEIKVLLSSSLQLISHDEINIIGSLKSLTLNLQKLKGIVPQTASLNERTESIYIELKDLAGEIEKLNEKTQIDPDRITFVSNRLNMIYSLQQKHRVKTVSELITIRESFREKLENIFFSDEKVMSLENEIHENLQKLNKSGGLISDNRKKVISSVEKEVNRLLEELGMKSSTFKIYHQKNNTYSFNGCDEVKFMFSPGKDIPFNDLAKTASGGEISRLMLSIKSLLTRFTDLPTIIFDEIDTGISGETADKMGNIIKRMSENLQVINITHLPQVASKGDNHFLVLKTDKNNITETRMKLLSNEERIIELARMLSGSELTDAAIQNAKELLKG